MDKKTQLAWYNKEISKDKIDIEQHKRQLIAKIKKQGISSLLNTVEVKKEDKGNIWKRMWNNTKKRIGF